jgi:predicted nucleic acid-binding protein
VIVYLDTSVLLRWVLDSPGQLHPLAELGATRAMASELLSVEAFRVLDQRRVQRGWTPQDFASKRDRLGDALESVDLVDLHAEAVWRRVREPYVTPVGTLDAVHLATALLLRDVEGVRVETVLTHDPGLALAAQAYQFHVLGVT